MPIIHPIVDVTISNSEQNLLNSKRTIICGLIAPSNSTTYNVGDIEVFTNLTDVYAKLGHDTSNGNFAVKYIEEIFAQNDHSIVKYAYCGKNTASGTAIIVNNVNGYEIGSEVITLTDASAFSVGDTIKIGTGADEIIRKISAIAVNDITIAPIDVDVADTTAVEIVTLFASAGLGTCRTALRNEKFRIYIEENTDYADILANVVPYLNNRDDDDLFTQAFFGFDFGVTTTQAKTLSTALNNKFLSSLYGLLYNEDIKLYGGVYTAVRSASIYARELSAYNQYSKALISLNAMPLDGIKDVVNNETYKHLTVTEDNDLIDNYVSAISVMTVLGEEKVAFRKIVTTYNLDDLNNPSTDYTLLAGSNIDILFKELLDIRINETLQRQVLSREPLNSNNIGILLGDVESEIARWSFIDRNYANGGFEPTITGNFTATVGEYEIKVRFKGIDSIDRVFVKGYRIFK